jgi:DNA polymerase III alpha subunit
MDVDLDFADRSQILKIIQNIPAAIVNEGKFKKHNTGVYVQDIPYNPLTETASIDYKEAEDRGYFKIDFLNVGIYLGIRNRQHLDQLVEREPLWELLEQEEFVDLVFHLRGHSNILKISRPKNIEQLAAVLAMIRPAKRHLVGQNWDLIMNEIWTASDNGEYAFKKSHAVSYAVAVIVHMNLLCEQLNSQTVPL